MKIWCDNCKGMGNKHEWHERLMKWELNGVCLSCDGKGYVVNETIEHEARVGRAFKEAIKYYNLATNYMKSDDEICSEEELLKWMGEE